MKNVSSFHPKAIVESKSVGKGTRIWPFTHVMKGASIGKDCNIGEHCYIETKSKIGNRVTIKNGVAVWDGVFIEDDAFIGPNTVFTNDLFPISRDWSRKKERFRKTFVKKGACIGANSTIICGVTIGRHAFVGAGSVVTKELPDYGLAYGNPARIYGFMCKCRRKLKFSSKTTKCHCGIKYKQLSTKKIILVEAEN